MKVTIRRLRDGNQEVVGSITLQDGRLVAEPEKSIAARLLNIPIAAPDGSPLRAEKSPEEFLRNLCYTYKSAYLCASEPEEDEPEEEQLEYDPSQDEPEEEQLAEDDPDEKVGLIADILAGAFGVREEGPPQGAKSLFWQFKSGPQINVPFQGPSGRWFVLKPVGNGKTRVVPAKAPRGEDGKSPRKPGKEDPSTGGGSKQEESQETRPTEPPVRLTFDTAKQAIQKVHEHGVTEQLITDLVRSLNQMTVADLQKLRSHLGAGQAPRKAELVEKIREKVEWDDAQIMDALPVNEEDLYGFKPDEPPEALPAEDDTTNPVDTYDLQPEEIPYALPVEQPAGGPVDRPDKRRKSPKRRPSRRSSEQDTDRGEEAEGQPPPAAGGRAYTEPVDMSSGSVDEVVRSIRKGLARQKHLSRKQQRLFGQSMEAVLRRMPSKVVADMHLQGIGWHASRKSVNRAFVEDGFGKYLSRGERLLGYYNAEGALHLDGVGGMDDLPGAAGRGKSVQGVFAHELGHAIDGKNTRYSRTPEWRDIWKEEIVANKGRPRLSAYAASDTKEGLAEFCRLVYGPGTDMNVVKKKFPRAVQFFQDNGLLE